MFYQLFIGASLPQKADKTTPLAVKTAGAAAVFILEPATESAVSGMPSQNHKKTVLADGFLMAGVTGLEPATSCVTGRRSNQLSYTPIQVRFPLYLTFFFIASIFFRFYKKNIAINILAIFFWYFCACMVKYRTEISDH